MAANAASTIRPCSLIASLDKSFCLNWMRSKTGDSSKKSAPSIDVGHSAYSRQCWDHIRHRGLQDPKRQVGHPQELECLLVVVRLVPAGRKDSGNIRIASIRR